MEIRIADDGEVLVRGPNRFVGYWQNPEATAAAIDADGWYHTGDIGELDADGFLTLRGRKKDMIALPDGQKVYPDDVEAVLVGDDAAARRRRRRLDGDGGGVRVHAVLLTDDPPRSPMPSSATRTRGSPATSRSAAGASGPTRTSRARRR